jgi:enoyl-CoA hydratase/carnithine racemase
VAPTEFDVATSPASELISDLRNRRLRLILNRPNARNALTPALLDGISRIVSATEANEDIDLVTLEGAGRQAFSAGFDIKVMGSGGVDPKRDYVGDAVNAIRSCPAPTIALIDGYCFGAGLDLALAFDFRIATARASFAIPANRLGTVYDPKGVSRIIGATGAATARRLLILGKRFDANEAMAAGLISLVVDEGGLEQAVADWADMTGQSRYAVRSHKRIIQTLLTQADRSDEFWMPLQALRAKALDGKERHQAIKTFINRGKR